MIGLLSNSEYSHTLSMNGSNYRTLLEEMKDMTIKWLSAIFSRRNVLKKRGAVGIFCAIRQLNINEYKHTLNKLTQRRRQRP